MGAPSLSYYIDLGPHLAPVSQRSQTAGRPQKERGTLRHVRTDAQCLPKASSWGASDELPPWPPTLLLARTCREANDKLPPLATHPPACPHLKLPPTEGAAPRRALCSPVSAPSVLGPRCSCVSSIPVFPHATPLRVCLSLPVSLPPSLCSSQLYLWLVLWLPARAGLEPHQMLMMPGTQGRVTASRSQRQSRIRYPTSASSITPPLQKVLLRTPATVRWATSSHSSSAMETGTW